MGWRALVATTAVLTLVLMFALIGAGSAQRGFAADVGAANVDHHQGPAAPYPIISVSCPTASLCVAVDGLGQVLASNDPSGGYQAWQTVFVDPAAPAVGIKFAASISCPSASLCVVWDSAGNMVTSSDPGQAGTWNVGNVASAGDYPLCEFFGCHALSCPSVSLCVASDGAGDILSSSDPAGGAAAWKSTSLQSDTEGAIDGVTCASESLCIAFGVKYPASGSGPEPGELFTSTNPTGDASAWTATTVSGTSELEGGSCPSASLCVAFDTDYGGHIVTSTNPTGGSGAWTVTKVLSGDQLTALSCPSSSLCVGVDEGDDVLTSTDPTGGAATWTTDALSVRGGFTDVSCPSVSLCAAVAGSYVASSTDPTGGSGAWSSVHVDGGNPLDGVSCPSESFCVAGDDAGYVVGSTDPAGGAAAWSTVDSGDRNGLDEISCPSPSLCAAIDGQGAIATSTDPLGGSPWSVAGVFPAGTYNNGNGTKIIPTDLSCPSTSFCVAVADTQTCFVGIAYECNPPSTPGYVATTDDPAGGAGAWTVATLQSAAPTSVSCPTASLCVIGAGQNVVTATNPTGGAGAWSATQLPATISSVSCSSASLCVAVGYEPSTGSSVLVSTDPAGGAGAWQVTQPGAGFGGVTCAPGSSLCVGYDMGNVYSTTNPAGGAGAWSGEDVDGSLLRNPYSGVNDVSCASNRLCVAVDPFGNVIVGTGSSSSAAGSSPASTTPSLPSLASLRIAPRTFKLAGRRAGRRCVAITRKNRDRKACKRPIRLRVSFTLASAAEVNFKVERVALGRRVKKRCRAPTRANRHHRACTRLIVLRGTVVHAGKGGANSFTFNGRIGGHLLGPGTYRLIATPSSGGLTGAARSATFRIVR